MSESKALKDCLWKASILLNPEGMQFEWRMVTHDSFGARSINKTFISEKNFSSRENAVNNLEAFMARNGWTNWEWVE